MVSILIPVHNCRRWVGRAIESALAQTWHPREVIVMDDESTDGSDDVIARYRNDIRIERRVNPGQNAARNDLTAASTGEWLLYLDADDELAPDCVESKISVSEGAHAVFGTMEVTTFEGDRKVSGTVRTATSMDDPVSAAFLWRYPNTSAFMFRRSAVIAAGGWNESVRVCTDYELYFRLLLLGHRFVAAPASRSMYRHWSTAQAVHVSPVARVSMRLQLMTQAADTLAARGELNAQRQHAFEQSALLCIRSLYELDRVQAKTALAALMQRNANVSPSPEEFPPLFVAAFRLGGLTVAETLAKWRRVMRQALRPSARVVDYDAPGVTRDTARPDRQ